MRTLVLLLVLANLSFFAYTRLPASREGESNQLAAQVQPDKIKLLTPQQVAALGPAKVAALADVCLEWGPMSEADRARALAELEPFQLGKLLTQRRSETNNTFWVYLPSVANRADAVGQGKFFANQILDVDTAAAQQFQRRRESSAA